MRSPAPRPRSTTCPDHRSASDLDADGVPTMRPMTASPRIAPLPAAEGDARPSRLLAASPGGAEEPMHIFTTLAHQPELFRRWLGFGGALLGGKLSGRLRELVILRTAYRFNGRYEWAHHIELGERQGISAAETAAL